MKQALLVIFVLLVAAFGVWFSYVRTTACLEMHPEAPWWYCLPK